MVNEEVTNIVYKYKEQGLNTITRKTLAYDKALKQTVRTTQMLDQNRGIWLTTARSITPAQTAMQKFKGILGDVAFRFVGLQAVLSLAMRAFHQTIEFIGDGISKFREFENAMAEVSTILDETAISRLPALSAGIQTLSLAFGKSAVDLAGGMYQILSAAFSAEDAMRLLNTATKASVAGLSTVEESVDILTSILNAYGNTVSQAARISDYLFQTVVRGKLRFEDFASALGYITPIAANAGIAFKEIAAAMSTATRMGLHADMTVRGLSLGIQGFINPTEKAAEAAKKYDVEIGALATRIYGLQGMIEQLHIASEKFGKHIISEIVPNMRSFRVYAALAGDEGIKGFTEDMDLLTESVGRTEQAMQKIMNTTQFMAQQVEQNMEMIKRSVGESLTGVQINLEATKQALIGGIQSFLAGKGFVGGVVKVTEDIATNIKAARQEAINLFKLSAQQESKVSLYDALLGTPAETSDILSKMVDFDQIISRMRLDARILDVSEAAYQLSSNMITSGQSLDKVYQVTQRFDDVLRVLQSEIDLTQKEWDDLTDALDSFEQETGDIITTIDQIQITLGNLGEEVGNVGDYYDGTLGEELKLKEDVMSLEDRIRALQRALQGETIDMSELSDEMKAHLEAIKAQKEAYDALSAAMAKNRLEIMKLQLKGMIRRRGLLRSEERAIKKFEIENTKIRIEQLQMQVDAEEAAQGDHEEIVNDELQRLKDELFALKDTRQADIDNLKETIEEKEAEITSYTNHFIGQQQKLEQMTALHADVIRNLYSAMSEDIRLQFEKISGVDFSKTIGDINKIREEYGFAPISTGGIPTAELEKQYKLVNKTMQLINQREFFRGATPVYSIKQMSSSGKIKSNEIYGEQNASAYYNSLPNIGELINFRRGTYALPRTEPIMGHRGEQVVPAGSERLGGDTINITNNINAVINNDMDVEKLAAKLSEAESNQLMKHGRSNYRLRIG